MNQPMNQPTTPDLSNYGAQVIKESGRFALTYWPYCTKCKSSFQFDANEPFAYCFCGTTEWGDPRPASWVCSPRQPLNEKVEMNDKTEQALTDALIDQIESAARVSFRRHQRSIKGQILTAADNYDWHLLHAAYQAGIHAQLAEAQKDAERWRYLRDSGDDSIYAMRFDVDGDTPISGAELDVSIDAAKGKTS